MIGLCVVSVNGYSASCPGRGHFVAGILRQSVETAVEFSTASPPMGLMPNKPAEVLSSYTGPDIHRKTLERMALRGEIPGHKIGRFWRFRHSELDEWLRSKVNSSRQPCCTTTF